MKTVWYYLRFNYLNNYIYNLKYWVEWLISSYNMSHLVLELVVKICMFHLFFLFLFLDDSKKPINNLWTISTRLDFFDSLQIASQFSCNILHLSNFFFSFFFYLVFFFWRKLNLVSLPWPQRDIWTFFFVFMCGLLWKIWYLNHVMSPL